MEVDLISLTERCYLKDFGEPIAHVLEARVERGLDFQFHWRMRSCIKARLMFGANVAKALTLS